jgi:glycosyltransferase involved in cell wall biosynthesis
MKVAFLTTRFEKPSYRFRVQQFLPYLRANGVRCDSFLIPRSLLKRVKLFKGMRGYDIVFLQKKMLYAFDRRILSSSARRLIYDVDDALMYHERGLRADYCKRRSRRLRATMKMSDVVLTGNDFLCVWAANYCHRLITFPTVVDTDHYTPGLPRDNAMTVIGWCGSRSTNAYLNMVLPVLGRLAKSHDIKLRIVSDTKDWIRLDLCRGLEVEFSPWNAATEVDNLRSFDIGLMPLPDNDWARGKCALKALLYMSCGVPTVCSPIGAVGWIITDGENGFTAASEEEWYERIEHLVADRRLRSEIAKKAREHVVSHFSLAGQAPRLLQIFNSLVKKAED